MFSINIIVVEENIINLFWASSIVQTALIYYQAYLPFRENCGITVEVKWIKNTPDVHRGEVCIKRVTYPLSHSKQESWLRNIIWYSLSGLVHWQSTFLEGSHFTEIWGHGGVKFDIGGVNTQLLTTNLRNHTVPDNLPFEETAIRWYPDLPLNHDVADDMTGFDNGILVAYGMCSPCKLMEYYQLDPCIAPSHFMRGTAAEVWGDNTHEVMRRASSSRKDTDV